MSVPQIIQSWGYPVEIHTAVTQDNFNITLFRIPHGLNQSIDPSAPRPPVLVMHALLDSSAAFVMNLPSQSLGMVLADAGFDVWLGNNRGSTYSRPDNDDTPSWDWSFEEMAEQDLPAFVDYVLQSTGYASLGYIGHSEGTIQCFAALSELPELKEKINVFIALAPVAFVSHQQSKVFSALEILHIDEIVKLLGGKEFLPSTDLIKTLGEFGCNGVFTGICKSILFAFFGKNSDIDQNLNSSRIEIYISKTPAGTSVKNMVHWAQLVRSAKFQKYDYGFFSNLATYGSTSPPSWDLSKIETPMVLFTGGQDILADPYDVELLRQAVNPDYLVYQQTFPDYDHLDFSWGMDAHTRCYPKTIEVLQKYAQTTAMK
eukprot:TRINITY_DN4298_c0_g1_i1.p1 TRINITY_DN4298_c0_g1~~TRINITY_DN4298_c0_g1_i1.p1  ORF type:complete len:413 (-),score=102.22 TRINITY_DN4298_c0_g1_i1:116-1234(-)